MHFSLFKRHPLQEFIYIRKMLTFVSSVHHIRKKITYLPIEMNVGIQPNSRLMALHLFYSCMYPACQSTDSRPNQNVDYTTAVMVAASSAINMKSSHFGNVERN